MKRRTFAAVLLSCFALAFFDSALAAPDKKRKPRRAAKVRVNPLVAMLPASDAIVTVNTRRFFNDALPKVLSGNQKLLGEILARLDAFQAKTGINARRSENIAIGANILRKESTKFDVDAVVIARGSTPTSALMDAARAAANGKFREETIAGKTMIVISTEDLAEHLKSKASDPGEPSKLASKQPVDIGLAAIDTNTIVFGHVSRVRETLGKRSVVSSELTSLLGKKPSGVMNFAARVPGGMSTLLPLDNDTLGSNIDSISHMYGAVDMLAGQATLSVTGQTHTAQQAAELKGTLDGLKDIGTAVLSGSKAADKQLYARLLANIKVSQAGNEINLDLVIPQTDLDALVAIFRK